jgi:hypothetical protein
MNEAQRLFTSLSQLGRARALAVLGSLMAFLFGFIVWARGRDGGALSVFAGTAALLFAVAGVLGGIAFVFAVRGQYGRASRRSRQGFWFLLVAVATILLGVAVK